jgi:PAS domain S-box-containing protein
MSSTAAPAARPPASTRGRAPHDHAVQFYDEDDFLTGTVADFLEPGLAEGQPVVIIATEQHCEDFLRTLRARGIDVDAAVSSRRLVLRDARKTLATFLLDGKPDWQRFQAEIGGLLSSVATPDGVPVRAYGEMVDLLWRDGESQEAIRLEEFWNDLHQTHSFNLLCAYVMGNFGKEECGEDFDKVCALHSRAVPAESYLRDGDDDARLAEVSRLQQRARALEHEIELRKELEHGLRVALDDRRRAEEALRASQEDLVDFLENAAEGMHWVGADGKVQWANRAQLEMLGYAWDEYVGHDVAEFHVDKDVIADILARLLRNETVRLRDARLRCKDGSVKDVRINSNSLFRDGEFVRTRCFTRDVTDRKRLEVELERQNEELLRTVRFSELFVGILGHDLRNPLSAITTAASLLARRAETDKVSRPAARILSSAGRMARMIDQLLDFTRIRLGQGLPLTRSENDLAEVCRMAVDELDEAADGVDLRARGNPVGSWDGDRLMQLVSNLIGNAVAHGARTAPVQVIVDGHSEEDVVLEVKNAGTIAPAILPVIFEPFRSEKDRKEDQSSGLGLGLYISQKIVFAHSGSIEVRSTHEEGTCFTVRLPRG